MAQDARIVVDLLERHARVPPREEILDRYVRTYRGRKLGVSAGGAGAAAPAVEKPEETAHEAETDTRPVESATPTREMASLSEVERPTPHEVDTQPGVSETPTREMAAMPDRGESRTDVIETPLGTATGEPEADVAPEPTQMMPALQLDEPQEEAQEEEGDSESGEDEPGEVEVHTERPQGRPGKKKKRKKRRGLGA